MKLGVMMKRQFTSVLIGVGVLVAAVAHATTQQPAKMAQAQQIQQQAPVAQQQFATNGQQMPIVGQAQLLATPKGKLSYSIGVDLGRSFKAQGLDVDLTTFNQGMKDALLGGQVLMSDADMQQTLASFAKEMMAKREAEFNVLKVKNKQEGDSFLVTNKTKPGVVALPSGLQYKILKAGNGAQPAEKDIVTVNYVGTFINGKEFDSSFRRGKPATFPLSDMIPGWIEALKLMKSGSSWEVYIPSNLAYGERGAPPVVGPNQTLIFKIDLLDVRRADLVNNQKKS